MTKEQLFAEAMSLGPQDREDLIRELRSISDRSDFTADEFAELRRRVNEVDSGNVQTIPGELVMREARTRVRSLRRS